MGLLEAIDRVTARVSSLRSDSGALLTRPCQTARTLKTGTLSWSAGTAANTPKSLSINLTESYKSLTINVVNSSSSVALFGAVLDVAGSTASALTTFVIPAAGALNGIQIDGQSITLPSPAFVGVLQVTLTNLLQSPQGGITATVSVIGVT